MAIPLAKFLTTFVMMRLIENDEGAGKLIGVISVEEIWAYLVNEYTMDTLQIMIIVLGMKEDPGNKENNSIAPKENNTIRI